MAEFLDPSRKLIPLGEILLARHLIDEAQLATALTQQQKHGGRLGRILTGERLISALTLHQAIAQHYQLPFVNLMEVPCDPVLIANGSGEEYLALEAVPWHKTKEGIVQIATSDPTPALLEWAAKRYGTEYRLVITSPFDIRFMVERHFGTALDHQSREALWENTPQQSAKMTLSPSQKHSLLLALLGAVATSMIHPEPALLVIFIFLNLFYVLTILLKLQLFFAGATFLKKNPEQTPFAPSLSDTELPVYTVLVPLYKEERSLPGLLTSLRGLDYPKSRLDIKLIVEADDLGTIEAAKALKPEPFFEIIRVPYSLPRTKPKACNYALKFARGDYVTIYDAEDRPDAQQLRKAVEMFRRSPPDVVCLQARLNYYNKNETLLTRLFSIEYSAWFDYMLPGLEFLRMPIPLGGTSNHISLARLRELGEWDPYNVTEDADLGIRLACFKYRTGIVNSTTLEEAPVTLMAWLKQRSRWIKGYMQTWLVHMRSPVKLLKNLGPIGFWGFQFFIGGPCLLFVISPIFWVLFLLWAGGIIVPPAATLPAPLMFLISINIFLGMLAHGIMAMAVVARWKPQKNEVITPLQKTSAVLAFPFYWTLHSLASFKALWQLAVKPHFWEKTTHGVTSVAYHQSKG